MSEYFAVEYSFGCSLPIAPGGTLAITKLGFHSSEQAAIDAGIAALGAKSNLKSLILSGNQRWIIYNETELQMLINELQE